MLFIYCQNSTSVSVTLVSSKKDFFFTSETSYLSTGKMRWIPSALMIYFIRRYANYDKDILRYLPLNDWVINSEIVERFARVYLNWVINSFHKLDIYVFKAKLSIHTICNIFRLPAKLNHVGLENLLKK